MNEEHSPTTATDKDTMILVQQSTFQQNEVYQWLSEPTDVGGTVIFIGKVRDQNQGDCVSALTLEHYPSMTHKALADIVNEARTRWDVKRVAVIHRIGKLRTNEEIVLVGTSAPHRVDAYQANEFIMDYLKTRAPFWKKEQTDQGDRWVDGRESDQAAAERW